MKAVASASINSSVLGNHGNAPDRVLKFFERTRSFLRAAKLREAANRDGASKVGGQLPASLAIRLGSLRARFFRLRDSRRNENGAAVPLACLAAACAATVHISAILVRASVFFR